MSVDQETLVFRREGVSPSLSLLIPTFAFPNAPEYLTVRLQGDWNAPLPILTDPMSSADGLIPDYYPRRSSRLVSCYALFE